MSIDFFDTSEQNSFTKHSIKHSKMENQTEEKIKKVLSNHTDGITIVNISREIGVHRNTVSKYIFGLVKEKAVIQRRIGVASLCYLSNKGEKK